MESSWHFKFSFYQSEPCHEPVRHLTIYPAALSTPKSFWHAVAPPPALAFFNLQLSERRNPLASISLSPEPYQYSWVCRVRLCDGCLISLWSPLREACRSVAAPTTERAFEVQREHLLALISIYFLCRSIRRSTHTQLQAHEYMHLLYFASAWVVPLCQFVACNAINSLQGGNSLA